MENFFITKIINWFKTRSKKRRAVESGMKSLLKKQLLDIYYVATDRGFITDTEWEIFSESFDDYTDLGGNHSIPAYKKTLESFTKKPDSALINNKRKKR